MSMKIEVGYLIKPKKEITGILRIKKTFPTILIISKINKYSTIPRQTFDLDQLLVYNFKIGKYYYILTCIDIKDGKSYCFLIDLEKELRDLFSVISDDTEINKLKYQMITGETLNLVLATSYEQLKKQRELRIQTAKYSIQNFTSIPLFYIGDKVDVNGYKKEYRISNMSKAVTSANTELIYVKEKGKTKPDLSSIYHINLLERVKNPSLMFNSRYINNRSIDTYEIEKGKFSL